MNTPPATWTPGLPRALGVLVDWYALRFKGDPFEGRMALAECFLSDGLSSPLEWGECKPRNGFERGWSASICGMVVGALFTGGAHMRGWSLMELTGRGCGMVAGWDDFDATLRGRLESAQFKRVDLALDVLDGSLTFERAEAAWEAGRFDPPRGCRPGRNRQGYPEAGRTFYVGNRSTSDRFGRVYEKGIKEQHHPLGPAFDLRDWVRAEVEMKPANGPIPLDVIRHRDAFFAGAFPFFAELLEGAEGRRSQRDVLGSISVDVASCVRHLRRSAGPMLAVLLDVYGSPQALLEALTSGVQPSGRLIDAGAKLLERADLARQGV